MLPESPQARDIKRSELYQCLRETDVKRRKYSFANKTPHQSLNNLKSQQDSINKELFIQYL